MDRKECNHKISSVLNEIHTAMGLIRNGKAKFDILYKLIDDANNLLQNKEIIMFASLELRERLEELIKRKEQIFYDLEAELLLSEFTKILSNFINETKIDLQQVKILLMRARKLFKHKETEICNHKLQTELLVKMRQIRDLLPEMRGAELLIKLNNRLSSIDKNKGGLLLYDLLEGTLNEISEFLNSKEIDKCSEQLRVILQHKMTEVQRRLPEIKGELLLINIDYLLLVMNINKKKYLHKLEFYVIKTREFFESKESKFCSDKLKEKLLVKMHEARIFLCETGEEMRERRKGFNNI